MHEVSLPQTYIMTMLLFVHKYQPTTIPTIISLITKLLVGSMEDGMKTRDASIRKEKRGRYHRETAAPKQNTHMKLEK